MSGLFMEIALVFILVGVVLCSISLTLFGPRGLITSRRHKMLAGQVGESPGPVEIAAEPRKTELELGASVRLTVELRELEAYVRGIRFAMGQAPPWEAAAIEAEV